MSPEEFARIGPRSPDEFIGKAAVVARVFEARIKAGSVSPIKLLCYGEPGVGKTAVCKFISDLLAHNADVCRMSAARLTVDDVKEWMADMHYFGLGWRVYWVEEVDAVSAPVEVLLLQFLDELRDKCAALFTSNESLGALSARFQSRTQTIHFERPAVEEVARMLVSRWPELGQIAMEIAEANGGDVRASLNDAQMHLDVRRYKNDGGAG